MFGDSRVLSPLKMYPFLSAEWRKLFIKLVWQYKWIYLFMVAPALSLVILFRYLPMPGIMLSFETFKPSFGKSGLYSFLFSSDWVGLKHFQRMFVEPDFWRAFGNTIIISIMKLAIGFPFPIVLSLMINEVRVKGYKRVMQTVYTFPHFLSWVVVAGIALNFFGDSGVVKKVSVLFRPELANSWNFLYNAHIFRGFLVALDIWKEAGWGTILYLAAIAGVDQSLYEAAIMDGCGRLKRVWYITLPSIAGMIIILFILNIGGIMNANFDQVFNLYNAPVFSVGDVIDTYIYRLSFQSTTVMDFGFSTAVGSLKTIINFALLIFANAAARKMGYDGIM
ncbi:MAG: ABC transporter permease subunit [Clostridiales bacterium]|jgi:putative aldouronate transport system permease protein|nr:ABC transporter permease subunit [Clostridiales bacterium]